MMDLLDSLKSTLATIPGVMTCRIGLEDNITPDDYPIIRIVPSSAGQGAAYAHRKIELLIYFGMPIQAFDDSPDSSGRVRLEKLYAALLDMEAAIMTAISRAGGKYIETITDEDRIDTYKIMAVRCEVEG
jgi:hypothetical protein